MHISVGILFSELRAEKFVPSDILLLLLVMGISHHRTLELLNLTTVLPCRFKTKQSQKKFHLLKGGRMSVHFSRPSH